MVPAWAEASLLFVTIPAKILKLSETSLSTDVVLAAPAALERPKPLILTRALAQPLSAAEEGQGMGMKQINEVVIGWGADVKSNLPNSAERQPALSYIQSSLFLLTVCWKDLHCVLLNTSVNLLQADAFCFISQWHKKKMRKNNSSQISDFTLHPNVVKPWKALT